VTARIGQIKSVVALQDLAPELARPDFPDCPAVLLQGAASVQRVSAQNSECPSVRNP
jgi:hypothetical protein